MIIPNIIMGLVLAINVILCIYQYRAYKKAKAEPEQVKAALEETTYLLDSAWQADECLCIVYGAPCKYCRAMEAVTQGQVAIAKARGKQCAP